MQRIQRMATALLPVMGVFCLFYVIFTGHDALDLAILTPERWLDSRYADPQVQIPQSARIVAALALLSPVIAGLVAVLMAIYVLNLGRQGVLFDERIARGFRVAGVATAVSGILGWRYHGSGPRSCPGTIKAARLRPISSFTPTRRG